MSLNVIGGVLLIKPAKTICARYTSLNKHNRKRKGKKKKFQEEEEEEEEERERERGELKALQKKLKFIS